LEGTDVGSAGFELLLSASTDRAAARTSLAAAAPAGFTFVDGPSQVVERVWLDTFDGRLAAAGLALAYTTMANVGELVLSDGKGELRQPARLRLPALIEAVPPGPVRDRIAGPVWIRALLATATVRATVDEISLLNRDAKTVVRARLDRGCVVDDPAGTALPPRLTLVAVRGYERVAARLAAALVTDPNVEADARSESTILRANAGRGGSDSRAGAADLRPDSDATAAVGRLLLRQLDTVEANVGGTVDDVDTEFLHDLRVAVRRTRSTLKLVGDLIPAATADRFAREFGWLGDLTTPMRDLDTLLLGFDEMAADVVGADSADLEPLRVYLGRRRAAERRKLSRGLRSARFTEITRSWRQALGDLDDPERSITAAALARDRIGRAWRRVVKRGLVLGPQSPPEAVHDLRKRCKELRYGLELFAFACRRDPHQRLVRDLKVLQDRLGEFQDAEVHRDLIRSYAEGMLADGVASAPTLLAMGELVGRFGVRQREAGAAAIATVAGFVNDRNRRRIADLVVPVPPAQAAKSGRSASTRAGAA
jgi:CHAD domain-containing protein